MNIKTSWTTALSLSLLLTACASADAKPDVATDLHTGWMQGHCLASKNPRLHVPQPLTIIPTDAMGGGVIQGTVTGRASSAATCPALMQDRASVNKANGYYFYSVRTDQDVGLAIGILGNPETGDLKASSCATSEGVRFTLSSKHSVIWEGYDYLGYDIESTCPDS